MAIDSGEKHRIKKILKELETYRGRHTELVTVYIPSGYELSKIINHLQQEAGTASNIKSAGTRKNVIDALEKMIVHLRLFKNTPPRGLAVFSGNVAAHEGDSDVRVWSIEPPDELKIRLYRCDKEFLLEPLREMIETTEIYGLVVLDKREANIAMLKGKTIIPLVKTTSNVPGKMKVGGQSAHRFAENRELAAKDFYHRVAEHLKSQFFNKPEVKGIIVGGPGPTKYEWVEGDFITNELKKRIIAIKDITYTDEFGLHELLEKSQDVLAKEEVAEEKAIMNKFFEYLAKKPAMVTYGVNEVRKFLEMGVVDSVLISEEAPEPQIEEFTALAEKTKSKVRIISTETGEGKQLALLGKFAAILRYEVNV